MKAAVLQGVGQELVIEEFETPDVGDDDVLLEVAACGVCHTDLKVQDGSIPSSPPTVLGHEVSGTVVGAGKNQREHFKDGDHVTVGMRFSCGRCEYCTSGLSNLCNRRPHRFPVPQGGRGDCNAVERGRVHAAAVGPRVHGSSTCRRAWDWMNRVSSAVASPPPTTP